MRNTPAQNVSSTITTHRGILKVHLLGQLQVEKATALVTGSFDLVHVVPTSLSPELCAILLTLSPQLRMSLVLSSWGDSSVDRLLSRFEYQHIYDVAHCARAWARDPKLVSTIPPSPSCKTVPWKHLLEDNLVDRCLVVLPTSTTKSRLINTALQLQVHTTVVTDDCDLFSNATDL